MTHQLAKDFPQFAQRVNAIQERRIAGGCISKNGASHPTKAHADWYNDLIDWHERGRPQGELDALKARKP